MVQLVYTQYLYDLQVSLSYLIWYVFVDLTETQGQASTSPSGLWKEYDEIVALTASLKEKQGEAV